MTDGNGASGLKDLIVKFFGPAAEEVGQLAADQVRYFRWQTAVRIVERSKKWAEERGIQPKVVPLRFFLPFLEKCSLEEPESDMADRWSRLLLDAATHYESKHEIYLQLLSSITADEARLLRCMFCSISRWDIFHYDKYSELYHEDWGEDDLSGVKSVEEAIEKLRNPGREIFLFEGKNIPNTNELHLDGFEEAVMFMHLESLNLVRSKTDTFITGKERNFVFYADITPLGYDLISRCEENDD